MALNIDTIFPCVDKGIRLLEPKSCTRAFAAPTMFTKSESNLVYRRRISKGTFSYAYEYENIMAWEYRLIEEFFRRRQGRYEEFWMVDWSDPYIILSTNGSTEITLNHITTLTTDIGYVGYKVLICNQNFDPQDGVADKDILTITQIVNDTITFTMEDSVTGLLNTGSMVYLLSPVIFDIDALSPQKQDTCIERNIIYFSGFGAHSLFGPIVSITIPFLSLGIVKDLA